MPSGMQIFNSTGQIVADVTSPTLALRNKYTMTIPAGTGLVRSSTMLEVPNTELPFFAIRPNSANRPTFILSNVPKVGTPTTRQIIVSTCEPMDFEDQNPPTVSSQQTSYTVTLYYFDRPQVSGTYGLQLFDASGNCTFDSAGKFARVFAAGVGSYNLGGSQIGAVAANLTSRYRIAQVGGVGWREGQYREYCTVNGSAAVLAARTMVGYVNLGGSPTAVDRIYGYEGGFVLPVTGY